MKSNKSNNVPGRPAHPNLHQSLRKEKEALVTMFLSSASQKELTEQIKKIDRLCTQIDHLQRNKPLL